MRCSVCGHYWTAVTDVSYIFKLFHSYKNEPTCTCKNSGTSIQWRAKGLTKCVSLYYKGFVISRFFIYFAVKLLLGLLYRFKPTIFNDNEGCKMYSRRSVVDSFDSTLVFPGINVIIRYTIPQQRRLRFRRLAEFFPFSSSFMKTSLCQLSDKQKLTWFKPYWTTQKWTWIWQLIPTFLVLIEQPCLVFMLCNNKTSTV